MTTRIFPESGQFKCQEFEAGVCLKQVVRWRQHRSENGREFRSS